MTTAAPATPPALSAADITRLVDAYEARASTPRAWIAGLSPAQLDAHPVPGTWSMRQLVIHMIESDLAATHRMRRIAVEDHPLLVMYDETAMAQDRAINAPDIALVCDLFALNRRFTGQFLRACTPEQFARKGVHSRYGHLTLERMVAMYAEHVDGHAVFANAKRAALGLPLARA